MSEVIRLRGRVVKCRGLGRMSGDVELKRRLTALADECEVEGRVSGKKVIGSREGRMAEKDGDRIVETAVGARGAERGPTVRNILYGAWALSW